MSDFKAAILRGIPDELPSPPPVEEGVSRAPAREMLLDEDEKRLALRNALRYFPEKWHAVLAPEFARELAEWGRIYMHRFRPHYEMKARPIEDYPARSRTPRRSCSCCRTTWTAPWPSTPTS